MWLINLPLVYLRKASVFSVAPMLDQLIITYAPGVIDPNVFKAR